MGALWVARSERLDRDVAIKFLAPALEADALDLTRFEREARAIGRLSSPHVVQIFDCGVDQGWPYIAMELLRGEDLRQRLSKRRRLDFAELAVLATQMAKGLRHAHEAGIVHRDLKPGNVFLATIDGVEVVKLLDFGLAKLADDDACGAGTATGAVVGSANYLSPEQSRSARRVDHRTDLWSFGVILYCCLTGALPFTGDVATDVIVKICTEPAAPPSRLVPGLPPSVDAFFARALARDLADRFQSAAEMARAFRAAMAEAVAASASPRAERLRVRAGVSARAGQATTADAGGSPEPDAAVGQAMKRMHVLARIGVGAGVALGLVAIAFGVWRGSVGADDDRRLYVGSPSPPGSPDTTRALPEDAGSPADHSESPGGGEAGRLEPTSAGNGGASSVATEGAGASTAAGRSVRIGPRRQPRRAEPSAPTSTGNAFWGF